MLMAVEHTSDTFYWRLLLVSSPTHIFAERCMFSSALVLPLFPWKFNTELWCNRDRFNCRQCLQRYCDLRQYLPAEYAKKICDKIKINRNLIKYNANLKVYCRSLVCWIHQDRIFLRTKCWYLLRERYISLQLRDFFIIFSFEKQFPLRKMEIIFGIYCRHFYISDVS